MTPTGRNLVSLALLAAIALIAAFAGGAFATGDERPAPVPGDAVASAPDDTAGANRTTAVEGAVAPATDPAARSRLATTGARTPIVRVAARHAGDGSPAPDIALVVVPTDGRHAAWFTRAERTDPRGVAEFGDLGPGHYRVIADRAPAPEPSEGGDAGVATFDLLQAGEPLVLSFGDGEAGAAGGQTIQFELFESVAVSVGGQGQRETESPAPPIAVDRQRAFRVDEPSAVDPGDHVHADFELGDDDLLIPLELPAGARLSGRVEAPDGSAVAGATVWLLPAGGQLAQSTLRTDADGRFACADAPPGARLVARAADYAPSRPVAADAATAGEELVLRLTAPVGALEIDVLTAERTPLPGARVRIGPADGELPPLRTVSDADGHCGPTAVAEPSVPVLILARGYEPWLATVRAGRPDPTHVEAVLTPAFAVHGVVRNADGSAAAGIVVSAASEDRPSLDVTTGRDGTFELDCLPAGPVQLEAHADDDWRNVTTSIIGVPGQQQDCELVREPFGHVRLRVLDESNAPLRDWVVRARALAGDAPEVVERLDDEGRAELRCYPERRYTLELQNDRLQRLQFGGASGGFRGTLVMTRQPAIREGRQTIPFEQLGIGPLPGATGDVVVVVPGLWMPTARLRGRLVDAQGTPQPGTFEVRVGDGSHRTRIGDDGRFDTGLVVPGPFTFRIEPAHGAPFELDRQRLAPREVVDLGDVVTTG
ncbi:MAG: carboxypeptidase regulatory-like domain-containing protein [Planctomycetes bacterium]|nr:carboxypeptidase regulatory-like domain-containing protein [Planctomycetota bacterium]